MMGARDQLMQVISGRFCRAVMLTNCYHTITGYGIVRTQLKACEFLAFRKEETHGTC